MAQKGIMLLHISFEFAVISKLFTQLILFVLLSATVDDSVNGYSKGGNEQVEVSPN